MGHEVLYDSYSIDKSKASINALSHEISEYHSDSRGPLNANIRFIDVICEDWDAAIEKIESLDNGWYDQLAVKYYSYEETKESKRTESLRERLSTLTENLKERKQNSCIKNRKSKFITCTKCKSSVNKEYIDDRIDFYRWNCCPVCGEDLMSNTVKEMINTAEEKIQKCREELNDSIKKDERRGKRTLNWCVKIEFHV